MFDVNPLADLSLVQAAMHCPTITAEELTTLEEYTREIGLSFLSIPLRFSLVAINADQELIDKVSALQPLNDARLRDIVRWLAKQPKLIDVLNRLSTGELA